MAEEAEIAQRANQVQQLLARKDKVGALAAALQNPPVNSKSEELKVNWTRALMTSLIHFC